MKVYTDRQQFEDAVGCGATKYLVRFFKACVEPKYRMLKLAVSPMDASFELNHTAHEHPHIEIQMDFETTAISVHFGETAQMVGSVYAAVDLDAVLEELHVLSEVIGCGSPATWAWLRPLPEGVR